MVKKGKVTPLMQQYFEIREQFQDTMLFFQVGDFFELFFEDAVKAASFLNIALTKRGTHLGEPVPLCGVPSHALNTYLNKLVKGGFKVAICEQLEEPTPGKVVRRGVTRVLTPGTLTDSNLLDDKAASYFCSFFPTQNSWGVLFGELLTSQLFATMLPAQSFKSLESELLRFFPDEILLPSSKTGKALNPFFKSLGYVTTFNADAEQEQESMRKWLDAQFQDPVKQKLSELPALHGALKSLYAYLDKCQQDALPQFNSINFYEPSDFLILDAATQKHLELVRNSYDGSRRNSLLELVDKSSTAMGSRMVAKWLMRPLVDYKNILRRQDAIEVMVQSILPREKLVSLLKVVADLERVVGRIALGRGLLVDYLQLKIALQEVPKIKDTLVELGNTELLKIIDARLIDFTTLYKLLFDALNDGTNKDWIIKSGYNSELDHVRELVGNASKKIIELEQREQVETGINSLKIRFNNVQGYYIEVTKPNLHLVPSHYLRQQTLVGKERFITEELRQLQVELDQARQNIDSLEAKIFDEVKSKVYKYIHDLRKLSHALAHLDALLGLARTAYEYGYVRPTFNDVGDIAIKQGRHPVVEQMSTGRFIPNDTNLVNDESMWIITGPNMGGKSTYLRQTAVICVLAQCGSFVPAQSVSLPILDRVFTRIGASDNLALGKSTFLVEMEETATICRDATKNSLVILDEVGRGTSTFDGLAIAQSVVEYIYEQVGAKCLFATHYHELTVLTDKFPGIASYYAASKRSRDGIVLLHKIVKGVADGSFGVEVAKCAELPQWIVERAQVLLKELHNEGTKFVPAQQGDNGKIMELEEQIKKQRNVLFEIEKLDLDNMSPREAFDLLWKLQKQI